MNLQELKVNELRSLISLNEIKDENGELISSNKRDELIEGIQNWIDSGNELKATEKSEDAKKEEALRKKGLVKVALYNVVRYGNTFPELVDGKWMKTEYKKNGNLIDIKVTNEEDEMVGKKLVKTDWIHKMQVDEFNKHYHNTSKKASQILVEIK